MAFMAAPRLVLLDEPAGGVNLTMLVDLQRAAARLNTEQRATFVVIEHNMEFVMRAVPARHVHGEGRVLAEGEPHECGRTPP